MSIEPRPAPTPLGAFLLGMAGGVVGLVVSALGYKVVQAITDEDYGTTEFPPRVRQKLISEHIARHGRRCPGCRWNVRRRDLTVDHIVALANGGRTSTANARVLCRTCNSRKGARNTVADYIAGRGT